MELTPEVLAVREAMHAQEQIAQAAWRRVRRASEAEREDAEAAYLQALGAWKATIRNHMRLMRELAGLDVTQDFYAEKGRRTAVRS
jgi:hypothetical protein